MPDNGRTLRIMARKSTRLPSFGIAPAHPNRRMLPGRDYATLSTAFLCAECGALLRRMVKKTEPVRLICSRRNCTL